MARAKLSLARKSVDYWLEHLAGDVSHLPSAERDWSRLNLDYPDIIRVLEIGRVTYAIKENGNVSRYKIIGKAIDGQHLCITISIEPVGRGVCILNVVLHSEQDNDYFNHAKHSA